MMKSYAAILVLVLSTILRGQSLTLTENYVYSRSYLTPVAVETPTAKQIQSVTYYDGLGRPKQQIDIKATPSGKDLITPIEYDGFGRQTKDWLPLPQTTTGNGAYNTLVSTSTAQSLYGDNLLYAEKELENSPLDRILQQAAPGSSWSLASGKTVKYGYEANVSTDNVKRYVTATSWSGNATVSTLKIFTVTATETTTYYPSGTLYKNKVTDEDGNISYEFKNGEGQTLLVRKMNGTASVDTYYVYNEYNQLAFVIPPLASDATKSLDSGATVSSAILDDLCYQYRYDGRNRLVEKKLPGKGWEYMVYDKQDRLILTQDSILRQPTNNFGNQGWLFTKYDMFGRVVYTGFFKNTASRTSMQTALNSMNSLNVEQRVDNPSITLQGMPLYYTKNAFPTGSMTLLSVNYYDTYPPDSPAKPATIVDSTQPTLNPTATSYTVNNITSSRSTKGLPTAGYIKNIEDNGWTKNYTWYDTKGRAIATHSYNHLGGYTKTDNLLDFSGVPTYSYTYHKRMNADAQMTVRDRYVYDTQNRLTHHYHQVNAIAEELLAEHTYNELGQLSIKKMGTGTLQEVNYTYNVRGWLTKINNPANLGSKLFGYEIKYQNPASTGNQKALYNGNISQIDWATKSDGQLRRYTYQYDSLNRLLSSYYAKPTLTTPNTNAYNENLTYDNNGNILTLQRFGGADGITGLKIDQLAYTYTGNRLNTVTDTSGNTLQGYPAGGNAITYDANGNMIKHLDKNISSIAYNYLNLPNQMTQTGGNTSYVYRADGLKLRKTYGIKTTDYLDAFQYETVGTVTTLQFIPTSEGYYDVVGSRYVYNYTDHLGNVRLSYYRNGTVATVLEENNYYPFGLKHEGYNSVSTATPSYKYKYNGKELQETGMYAMDWRQYMPDIARFGVMDPLSALIPTVTPYRFAFNNPVYFSDPSGLLEEVAHCPTCPNTPEFKPYIDDKYNVYVYNPETNTAALKVTPIEEVVVTGKKSESNTTFYLGILNDGIGETGDWLVKIIKAGQLEFGQLLLKIEILTEYSIINLILNIIKMVGNGVNLLKHMV